MALRRRFTLVLIPHNKANTIEIKPLFLGFGLALMLGLSVGIWGIGSTYIMALFGGGAMARLEQENAVLKARLNDLDALTDSFRKQLDEVIQKEKEARMAVGLPAIHPDVRKVGIGGPTASLPSSESAQGVEKDINQVHSELDQLLREARLGSASLRSIMRKAGEDQEYWRHVPTIRPVDGTTTSAFGMRNDPFTGLRRMHAGFDISAYPGEKVRATADGVVINTGMDVNYGRFIEIDHKNGYMTRYGHLSKVNINQSQPIKRGDIIGHVGNTGRASGYHLHYEVHRNGRVVNPSAYFFPEHTVVD